MCICQYKLRYNVTTCHFLFLKPPQVIQPLLPHLPINRMNLRMKHWCSKLEKRSAIRETENQT